MAKLLSSEKRLPISLAGRLVLNTSRPPTRSASLEVREPCSPRHQANDLAHILHPHPRLTAALAVEVTQSRSVRLNLAMRTMLSPDPGSPTRRDAVSPVPLVTIRGYVQVYKFGTVAGWIGAKGGDDYNWYSSSVDRLIVSFSLPVGQNSGSGLNLLTEVSTHPREWAVRRSFLLIELRLSRIPKSSPQASTLISGLLL